MTKTITPAQEVEALETAKLLLEMTASTQPRGTKFTVGPDGPEMDAVLDHLIERSKKMMGQ